MLVKISTIEKIRSFYRLLPLLLLCLAFNSCKKSPPTKFISGSVQKGPFLNGSSVTVSELDEQLTQSGRSFSCEISDNLGSFSLNEINLVSNYVSLRAEGFYFNEVCGENSVAPIMLSCIADIQNTPAIHINLLTHLEKARVQYLVANGTFFQAAKKQAQAEVLNVFNISDIGIDNSEKLDISQTGEGNAILLAVTSILQGYRTESELSNLLSDISSDLKTDGVLNDTVLQSSIIAHALLLDTVTIRSNITSYYTSRNVPVTIAKFEHYIAHFINNSSYSRFGSVIDYPAKGLYGDNLLYKTQTIYSGIYSLAANLKNCTPLRVKFIHLTGNAISFAPNYGFNWVILNSSGAPDFFESLNSYGICDMRAQLYGMSHSSTYRVNYFEKDTVIPSFSKVITCYD